MWGYANHGWVMGDGGFAGGIGWVISFTTWVLIIAVLVALFRFLWKKGNGK